MEIFFCLYKIVLCPFSSQLLYFDLFLFATYLFNNLLNYSVSTYVSIIYRKKIKIKKKNSLQALSFFNFVRRNI